MHQMIFVLLALLCIRMVAVRAWGLTSKSFADAAELVDSVVLKGVPIPDEVSEWTRAAHIADWDYRNSTAKLINPSKPRNGQVKLRRRASTSPCCVPCLAEDLRYDVETGLPIYGGVLDVELTGSSWTLNSIIVHLMMMAQEDYYGCISGWHHDLSWPAGDGESNP